MRQTGIPLVQDLVLVGGGHTHALVLRSWGMRPVPGVRLTLINPGPTAPYSGMLPGHIAGHYTREALNIDLVRLARFAGARLILGAVTDLDPDAKLLHVPGRSPIRFDLCSVDIGITAKMDRLPGFAEHGVPAKPLDTFAARWSAFCDGQGPARLGIIGGGVAGVELALATSHRLQTLGRKADVTVLDRGTVLGGVAPRARAALMRSMDTYNVQHRNGAEVAEVTADAIRLVDGTELNCDLVIGAAGAVPHPWLAKTGLELQDGYMVVDAQLRSTSHPHIYGAGDCVHLSHAPRPKAGVFAVRAAPVLTHNLRADLTGAARRDFRPQRDFLKLISLGEKAALAEKAGLVLKGPAIWRWKDRIDQSFMDKFRHLPAMTSEPAPANAAKGVAKAMSGPQPCGGCGAKLGADALSSLLGEEPGEDAAQIEIGGTHQVLSHDHLRGFAEDPVLVAQVAAIHAMGDIWAMGARPQAALAQVILPRMAAGLQTASLAEIMDAARAIFAAEGAEIVGGHSSMGAELTIGFTVTGLSEARPIGLSGAKAGDALILSKALGTGVILAAEMQGKARGEDVAACWAAMATSQGQAAQHLAKVAHAMTDVTGFGLAGHLGNLCRASGVGAEVDLEALPLLPSALDLSATGIRSTLFDQNRASLADRIDAPETPLANLIFDPQTAGGLLAALPQEDAPQLVEKLRDLGHPAVQIGTVTAPGPVMTFR